MLNTDGRHDAIQEFRDAFESEHLQEGLPRTVVERYHAAANDLLALLPDGPALTRAIHDLWRSKNEAVMFAVRLTNARPSSERLFTYPPVRRPGPVGQLGRPWQGSAEQLDSIRSGGPIDRHPGRADGPAMAREPGWFSPGVKAAMSAEPDVEWPDHDEDDPDSSDGRHTLNEPRADAVETTTYGDLARGERKFLPGRPTPDQVDDTRSTTRPPD